MAEMSPIDVLRRYQEYETELTPLLLGLLTLPQEAVSDTEKFTLVRGLAFFRPLRYGAAND